MKTKLMIVLLCSLFVYTAAEAQWTMIPDNNFEQALIDLGIDDVMDGKVLTASVENVTYLDVIDKNISDLSGIEAFIWLNRLEAGGNQLSSINLLNNVRLETLDLRENQLSSIDLTSNLLLKYLILQSNNLTTLNISNNTELEQLFADNNQLTGIDVSQNNKLIYLNIGQNPLNELNISNNFEIQQLFIGFTSISEINVNHLLNLELLYIANTNIEEIVLQNNLKLEELVCSQTPLQNIDVSANLNLKSLTLGNTTVSSIDLSYNQKLERFISWYDNIPEIDLSDKPYLDFIFLQYSNVNTLNLTNSENISKIHIEGNFIDSIDLSNFINLNEVVLKSNQLKFLNLKNGYNQSIQNIDLENNPDLTCIQVDDAAWATANWTNIDPQMYFSENCGEGSYTLIPDNNFEQALIDLGLDDVLDGKVLKASVDTVTHLYVNDKNISDLTGIQDFVSLTILSCNNNMLTTLDLSNNQQLKELICLDNLLSTLDISSNSSLTHLNCDNNELTSLDVSGSTNLFWLTIQHNQLASLDVTQNPALVYLFCSYNLITELDLTNNIELKFFEAGDNKLSHLDLSNNVNLRVAVCAINQLNSLNLKNGNSTNITSFYAFSNPNLTCIQVDDPAWSEANWTQIDPQMYFSEFCGATGDDSDGDGVPDAFDDYPMDETRAFDNYFPAAGYGSLGFEDLWPGMGDYDFNDVVVDYRFHCITNAQNKVVEVKANFVLKASGASLRNGFGFNLPEASQYLQNNLSEVQVSGYHVTEAFVSLMENGFESGQSKPTIIVFDDFFNVMAHPGSGLGINTELDKPFVEFDTLQLAIQPSGLQFGLQDFKFEYWNPFIIVNNERGKEVHLSDYPPTDMADLSIFGTYDDNSNPGTGRYYKTANNLPWAIHVVEEFDWPLEKVSIVEAYRHFFDWAKSAGDEYENWYKDLNGYRDEEKLYIRE